MPYLRWTGIALWLPLSAGAAQAAEALRISDCDGIAVTAEDPREETLAQRLAQLGCQKLAHLRRFFDGAEREPIEFFICADMRRWFEMSGRSFRTAGVVSSGGRILIQPARSLRKLENVESLLMHELVHLMVGRSAGRNCPRWLDEGLAQWFEGSRPSNTKGPGGERPRSVQELQRLEKRWRSPNTSATQRRADYQVSLALVAFLVDKTGLENLLAVLPEMKSPHDPLELKIAGESLRGLLFSAPQPPGVPSR